LGIMKRLIPDHEWHRFISTAGGQPRFNGILFERMVRELLGSFFAGDWQSTSMSWDGGRDFVDRSIAGGEQWAECKMYRQNIGLRVLSPTLIMAVMAKVQQLLLFSHSDVNEPARRHLARLAADQGMTIRLFDGLAFDKLILAAPDIAARYFDAPLAPLPLEAQEVWTSGRLSSDLEFELRDLATERGHSPMAELPLDLFAPVIIELFIKNLNPRRLLTCRLDLSPVMSGDGALQLMGPSAAPFEREFELDGGEVRNIRLVVRASTSGAHDTPTFLLRCGPEGDAQVSIPLSARRIRTSLIRHPPLIGARFQRDLLDLTNAIALSGRIGVSLVHGHAGVGKSRFLYELGARLVGAGFIVVQLTLRSAGEFDWRKTIRSIVARITAMPDPDVTDAGAAGVEAFPPRHDSQSRNPLDDFLYYDSISDSDAFLDRAAELSVGHLRISARVLLVDDLHRFSGPVVEFVRRLIDRGRGVSGRAAIVVGVNADLIAENRTAAALYADLLSAGGDATSRVIEISEFTAGQVDEFMDNLLSVSTESGRPPFSHEYPQLAALIRAKVEPKPLALWQLIHLWIDSGIVKLSDRFFYITDVEALQGSLREAWRSLAEVMERRIALLKQEPREWAVLQFATIFGNFDDDDARALSIRQGTLEALVDRAFLRKDASGFEFYHGVVGRSLHQAVSSADNAFEEVFAGAWSGDVRRSFWSRQPTGAYNVDVALGRNPLASEQAIQACRAGASPTLQSQRAATHILEHLVEGADPGRLLSPVLGLTWHAGSLEGRKGQTRRLMALSSRFDGFRPTTSEQADDLAMVVASTGSQSLSDGFKEFAQLYLERWDLRLSEEILAPHTPFYCRPLRARVRNRMCVLYKDLGRLDEAVLRAEQSLEDCPPDINPSLAVLNFVDLGYVFYGDVSRNEEVLRSWADAKKIFEESEQMARQGSKEIDLIVDLVAGISMAMRGEPNEAAGRLHQLSERAQNKQSVYYHLQASVVSQIIELHAAIPAGGRLSRSRAQALFGGFQALEDRVATINIARFLSPVQYGKAICLMANEEPDFDAAHRLLDDLLGRHIKVGRSDSMTRAIAYDWAATAVHADRQHAADRLSSARLSVLGSLADGALRGEPAPPVTTFWTNGVNLPYA
jgi:hypothetical protein